MAAPWPRSTSMRRGSAQIVPSWNSVARRPRDEPFELPFVAMESTGIVACDRGPDVGGDAVELGARRRARHRGGREDHGSEDDGTDERGRCAADGMGRS